ncbi:hypothetical protein AVEN_237146-1 [Araneus ventricosus]|uniref:Uncharacterized protein n=1 Tax=Araneus ventricosus TaxID=182803 RepID=A0A4Y2UZ69_ARAVE|nr:hypothetical protein AVEN_237146-1 [Araneus ventricosus]
MFQAAKGFIEEDLLFAVEEKNGKFSMTSLCDKLECYIKALETLGVTTDKCASILYPMVEQSWTQNVMGSNLCMGKCFEKCVVCELLSENRKVTKN